MDLVIKKQLPRDLMNTLNQVLTLNCNLGAGRNLAEKIILGMVDPIRNYDKNEIKDPIYVNLSKCAILYCGAKDGATPIEVFQESARCIVTYHSWIGFHEIEEAFRLASMNMIDNVQMKAYGGVFSVSMIGDILTSYKNYRNSVIQNFEKEKYKIEKEESAPKGSELDLLNLMAINDFVEQVENEIERIQSGLMPKWRDWERVPAILAEKALKSNKIIIDKDFKKSIFEKAKEMAKIEVNYDSRNIKSQNRGLARKLIDAQFQIESPYFNNKIETIYAKLLIFEFIQSHKHETI